jgi:hypothetical protein
MGHREDDDFERVLHLIILVSTARPRHLASMHDTNDLPRRNEWTQSFRAGSAISKNLSECTTRSMITESRRHRPGTSLDLS